MHILVTANYEVSWVQFEISDDGNGMSQEAVELNCLDYILMQARTEEIQEVLCKVVRGIQKKRDNRQLEQYGARWVESQKEEAYEVQGRKSNEDIIRDSNRRSSTGFR